MERLRKFFLREIEKLSFFGRNFKYQTASRVGPVRYFSLN